MQPSEPLREPESCHPEGEHPAYDYGDGRLGAATDQEEALTATLTFNDESVTGCALVYPTPWPPPAEVEENEQYSVKVPRYGCLVTRFTTQKRIQWEE